MKILIVEDEPSLREIMVRTLTREQYIVEQAADYAAALDKIAAYDYDCILLDIMLPGVSGLRLLEELKRRRSRAAVIIISARDSLDDKIEGLELGADDYLIKPFAYPELLARIPALQRRAGKGDFSGTEFSHNGIVLDTVRHTVTRDGKPVNLSPKEYGVLLEIMKADGSYVNAEELFDTVGAGASATDITDAIKTTVYSLRRKLGEGNGITSTRGKGYRLS